MSQPDDTVVARELLAYVRYCVAASADFAAPPERLTGGYETSIFAFMLSGVPVDWSAPLVLRIFGPECDGVRAKAEAMVHNALADAGYPCPRVLAVGDDERIGDGHFVIMQRAPGRDLLSTIFPPSAWTFRATPALTRAQLQLHALDPATVVSALTTLGHTSESMYRLLSFGYDLAFMRARACALGMTNLDDGLRWIEEHRPAEHGELVICHGDFHPLNIIADGGRITGVIDWSVARIAPAEFDVGRTIVLMKCAPASVSGAMRPVIAVARRGMRFRYLRAYRAERPLDNDALRYFDAYHTYRCLAMGHEAAMHPEDGVRNAWGDAKVMRALAANFRAITDVNVVG